jgi:hypothetical protein
MEVVKEEKGPNPPPKKPSQYYRGPAIAATTAKNEPGFQGGCDELVGHVFDCAVGKQADRYTVTMKEIVEYIGINFTYGSDIRWRLEHEEELMVPKPISLDTNADAIDKRIWEKEIDEYIKRKAKHGYNYCKLFSLILGQCTYYLKSKLESLSSFPSTKEDFDVFQLINDVREITFHLKDSKYHLEALHDAKIRFYTLRQGKDVKNVRYLEIFQTHLAIIEQF